MNDVAGGFCQLSLMVKSVTVALTADTGRGPVAPRTITPSEWWPCPSVANRLKVYLVPGARPTTRRWWPGPATLPPAWPAVGRAGATFPFA